MGGLDLGGSTEPVCNAADLAEPGVEKGALNLLMPVTSRELLYDLSDDMGA